MQTSNLPRSRRCAKRRLPSTAERVLAGDFAKTEAHRKAPQQNDPQSIQSTEYAIHRVYNEQVMKPECDSKGWLEADIRAMEARKGKLPGQVWCTK